MRFWMVIATTATVATTMAQTWTTTKSAPKGTPVASVPISHGMLEAYARGDRVVLAFGNGQVQTQLAISGKTDLAIASALIAAMDRTFPEPTNMRSHHRVQSGPPIPGGMSLPVGFQSVPEQGRDTRVGHIDGPIDLKWHYDIGTLAGDYTLGDAEWRTHGSVRGRKVEVAGRSNGTIAICFPAIHANFVASPASRSELVLLLVTVLTYGVAN